MNSLWKIITDGGEYKLVDLPKITHNEWIDDDGWARYHNRDVGENRPLTYRCASLMYYENFLQNDCKNERGSDYERGGCYIEDGDIVVDVGANIGCFSRYAITKNPSRIICFEPFSKAFNCLHHNTEDTICELYNVAISNNNNPVRLLGSDSFSGGSNILDNSDNGIYDIKEEVKCMTLDDLFNTNIVNKIDFLKVDVEGAEINVIDGISIDNLKKVNKLSMEIHHNHISDEDKNKMFSKIIKAGFHDSFTFNVPNLTIQTWWRV